jgi:hypothetical protein
MGNFSDTEGDRIPLCRLTDFSMLVPMRPPVLVMLTSMSLIMLAACAAEAPIPSGEKEANASHHGSRTGPTWHFQLPLVTEDQRFPNAPETPAHATDSPSGHSGFGLTKAN